MTIMHELGLIATEYEDILYDRTPILFSGKNAWGRRILGSYYGHNETLKCNRYIHTLIDEKDYSRYLHHGISYRALMEEAAEVLLIEDLPTPIISFVRVSDLDPDRLPLPNSLYPGELAAGGGEIFEARMSGGYADEMRSSATVTTSIIEMIKGTGKDATGLLEPSELLPKGKRVAKLTRRAKTQVYAFPEGSFGIRFSIAPVQMSLFHPELINRFIGNYMVYCAHYFSESLDKAFGNKIFADLIADLAAYRGIADHDIPAMATKLHRSARNTAERFAKLDVYYGEDFTSFRIYNLLADEERSLVVSATEETSEMLHRSVSRYDAQNGITETVLPPQAYNIKVFHLNLKSRKGEAMVIFDEDAYQVRLEITGDGPIEGTDLTKSIHEDLRVNVGGRLILVENRPRRLVVKIGSDNEDED